MDIYVNAIKKLDITDRIVRIKDFSDIIADDCEGVENIQILKINSKKSALFLITSADVVRTVKSFYPDAHVFIIGEQNTIVNFSLKKQSPIPVVHWAKIIFVSAILLFGSATAVMSFFSDAEMARVFENVYHVLYGVKNDKPLILEVSFSIGIASGIIVFFNHFAGLKLTGDPTPLEVEMALYEDDISETIIDTLSNDRDGGKNA